MERGRRAMGWTAPVHHLRVGGGNDLADRCPYDISCCTGKAPSSLDWGSHLFVYRKTLSIDNAANTVEVVVSIVVDRIDVYAIFAVSGVNHHAIANVNAHVLDGAGGF